MFEDLAAAIEGLDVPVEPDSLVRAIALRDQLDARIAGAVGAFEADGWWAVNAAASMTAWLRAHARMTGQSAKRLRSVAMRLRSLPMCARGLRRRHPLRRADRSHRGPPRRRAR